MLCYFLATAEKRNNKKWQCHCQYTSKLAALAVASPSQICLFFLTSSPKREIVIFDFFFNHLSSPFLPHPFRIANKQTNKKTSNTQKIITSILVKCSSLLSCRKTLATSWPFLYSHSNTYCWPGNSCYKAHCCIQSAELQEALKIYNLHRSMVQIFSQ